MKRFVISKDPALRRGTNLLECLASLAVLMVLSMAAAKLLTSVTKIGLQANQDKMSRVAVERLSAAFRQDVADAEQVTIADDGRSVTLAIGDKVVQYQTSEAEDATADDDSKSIQRTQTSGDPATGKEKTALDRFALTQRCSPTFAVKGDLVTLRLTADGQLNPWIIQAVQP